MRLRGQRLLACGKRICCGLGEGGASFLFERIDASFLISERNSLS
jgi:hypothetical protein